MPRNFPEMWINRVETNLTTATSAPFLDGIAELDTEVVEVGSGSASEANLIHIPTSDFEPDVLVNNTAYPIALQEYDDDEVIIKLDKYQTLATTLSDDQVMGASYDRIDAATRTHADAILKKKYGKAIHSIAPAGNTFNTPVLLTNGDPVLAGAGQRLRFGYNNLVALKDAFDKAGVPAEDRRIVLCSDHWNDLLLDRKSFGDQLVNYKQGDLAPIIAGFQIFQYINNPSFNGTNKLAFGAVPLAGQFQASVAFWKGNIAKKTGLTKQYYLDAKTNPTGQTNILNYRHYFIACPKRLKFIGAIASGVSA
jgi:hypothetical protein